MPVLAPALLLAASLPVGAEPAALEFPHFPSRAHAVLWRNWELVPAARIAAVLGADEARLRAEAAALGLPPQGPITDELQRRSYITVIRRNWHLLPYDQLLALLDWPADKLAFTLKEDDFLWHKLGALKPRCEPVRWREPEAETVAAVARFREIAAPLTAPIAAREEPLFGFLDELTAPAGEPPAALGNPRFAPRFCYSYFAPFGDPLLEGDLDPYPDGYLERLAACGVDGAWLHTTLYTLAPFPWQPELSAGWETRLATLARLATRLKQRGMGLWIYLNEPRAMPHAFFEQHPELKGAGELELAALCTSLPEVRDYLRDSVARVFAAAPDLAGAFTITASENLTSCWSHHRGDLCPRCAPRGAAAVIAEVNGLIAEGIRAGSPTSRLICWDWGWPDDRAAEIIAGLPEGTAVQSVSEWSLPIVRGGVASEVGEYSISAVGPGPRATRHWALARARGLGANAKLQLGCTWELSAVPYVPACELIAEHLVKLLGAGVDGLQLGWSLGGYPSPNLELAGVIGGMAEPSAEAALRQVAERRYGAAAPAVLAAWHQMSEAFREFPYHIGVLYVGPQQYGPSNLLFGAPTGYTATMIGFPYDHLEGWRAIYPPDVWIDQMTQVADGFAAAVPGLRAAATGPAAQAVAGEADIAESAALHFRASANQARFVLARDALAAATAPAEIDRLATELDGLLRAEADTARQLLAIQCRDSRIGFEASNHYYYVPSDLVEKVLCCEDLRRRWLPQAVATRRAGG